MNFWTRHIPDELLTDYAAGHAPALLLATDIQAHVQTCPRCEGQLTTLAKIFRLMRTDAHADAAPDMLAWAKNAFRTRRKPQAANSLATTIQAFLRLELSPFTPALGERSAAGVEHQMLYHAGSHELDLRLTPHGKKQWLITGQVLGPCETGAALLESAEISVEAALNPLAEFVLPTVPAGRYRLAVTCDNILLEVPELSLAEH